VKTLSILRATLSGTAIWASTDGAIHPAPSATRANNFATN
jgi:hypothetical protein